MVAVVLTTVYTVPYSAQNSYTYSPTERRAEPVHGAVCEQRGDSWWTTLWCTVLNNRTLRYTLLHPLCPHHTSISMAHDHLHRAEPAKLGPYSITGLHILVDVARACSDGVALLE